MKRMIARKSGRTIESFADGADGFFFSFCFLIVFLVLFFIFLSSRFKARSDSSLYLLLCIFIYMYLYTLHRNICLSAGGFVTQANSRRRIVKLPWWRQSSFVRDKKQKGLYSILHTDFSERDSQKPAGFTHFTLYFFNQYIT